MKPILAVPAATAAFVVLSVGSHMPPPETRSFVYMQDNTPGGGETFTRSTDSISGDIALGKSRIRYGGRIAADGTIPRLDIQTSRAGDPPNARRSITMVVEHDTVRIIERVARKADTLRLASSPGTIPLFDPSIGLYEVIVARARSQKSHTVAIPVVKIDADDVGKPSNQSLRSFVRYVPGVVTFLSADTVMLGNAQEKDKVRIVVGPDGRARGAVSGADAKDHFAMRPTAKSVVPR